MSPQKKKKKKERERERKKRINEWILKERLIKHAGRLLFYCNYLTDDFPVWMQSLWEH
jgi:hypothetical protein